MGRVAERADMPDPVRLRLIESDLDDHDDDFDKLGAELAKIKGIMIGILVSTTTAAILLAINLVVANA